MDIKIRKATCRFEREPFIRPFGFKGGYLTEAWQTATSLESPSGTTGLGLSTQSVLWSDAGVFSTRSEDEGNSQMFAMQEYALKLLEGAEFRDPIQLLETIVPRVNDPGWS